MEQLSGARVAIQISDEIDFNLKFVKTKKVKILFNIYTVLKGSTHQEDKTITNIYTFSSGASQYIIQRLVDLKGEIDSNMLIVGDSNPLSPWDKLSRQKLNKETLKLNDTMNQMGLTDIYRTSDPENTKYFFSSVHGTLSKTDHIIGHKTNLYKF